MVSGVDMYNNNRQHLNTATFKQLSWKKKSSENSFERLRCDLPNFIVYWLELNTPNLS